MKMKRQKMNCDCIMNITIDGCHERRAGKNC